MLVSSPRQPMLFSSRFTAGQVPLMKEAWFEPEPPAASMLFSSSRSASHANPMKEAWPEREPSNLDRRDERAFLFHVEH
jgi:hypothetical protein